MKKAVIIFGFFLSVVTTQSQTVYTKTYDDFNRLVTSSDGTNTVVYSYDELGNRTQQNISVTLSVTENPIIGLTLYPNPTPKKVTIKAKNIIDKVVIYDAIGKLIKEQKNSKNTIKIDISNFSVGLYHFVVYSDGKKQSLKVVKK